MIDSLPGLGGGREAMQRQLGQRLVEQYGDAILSIVTTVERRLLAAVADQHDALGLAGIEVPDPEVRAERLRDLWMAQFEGRFPAFWVEHYAPVENPGEAAQYADLDAGEWETTVGEWADRYRRQDVTGTDVELAGAHTKARYGVPFEEFERVVVEWPEERPGEELQDVVAGPVERAISGVEQATDELRERED